MQHVNRKSLDISQVKERVSEKRMSLDRALNESSEDATSYKTNDSSRSGSSRFSLKYQQEEGPIFEEGELSHWRKWDEIPEEADEASSVGDEITPRRLEEDQEEIARINEELNSARMDKPQLKHLPTPGKKNLHLSHISSVNNSRDETAFMSPTSAGPL